MSGMTIKVYRINPETGERTEIGSLSCSGTVGTPSADSTSRWPRCRCPRCRERREQAGRADKAGAAR